MARAGVVPVLFIVVATGAGKEQHKQNRGTYENERQISSCPSHCQTIQPPVTGKT